MPPVGFEPTISAGERSLGPAGWLVGCLFGWLVVWLFGGVFRLDDWFVSYIRS